ncbi:Asp-tRNA(Asn)/Glu-tRNA(Gln) amidotransferase subunit GatC [Roseimicrobium sp. ORNL1]|uniref:Asp-tRNA(Asn)/Glu-tRNA(Gln) amidotransferase subunit GatC n=1 Tax=Roseimicrobium sp. ORNL1 TaxID=2711231 RepID=UPI0013E187B2|nr:Asp-tRNA(Asn)/Glu-tRNA(Gln) amidotransferase subunit GatC [Roseimicrobium sp. ORNL1]QIF03434.1 Asp-tRNA(Asn)/Glu-tRNA(Gln) amidotransferase subunit GatC [Roseimicrobium sp. ORNL1]
MSPTEINIQHTAKLARLQLTEEETARYQSQIAGILDYMKVLEAHADLASVEPTAHAMPVFDVWREDIPRDGFGAEAALSNAPRKAQGQFLITRVVEE